MFNFIHNANNEYNLNVMPTFSLQQQLTKKSRQYESNIKEKKRSQFSTNISNWNLWTFQALDQIFLAFVHLSQLDTTFNLDLTAAVEMKCDRLLQNRHQHSCKTPLKREIYLWRNLLVMTI
jgi:hypothetical protein